MIPATCSRSRFKPPEAMGQMLRDAARDGVSQDVLAGQLGCDIATVQRHASKLGIKFKMGMPFRHAKKFCERCGRAFQPPKGAKNKFCSRRCATNSLLPPTAVKTAADLFDMCIPEPNSGCLLWLGTIDRYGYGRVTLERHRRTGAHRLAYKLMCGDIPDDLEIDHLCRVKLCVNPAHLETVSKAENIQRAWRYRTRVSQSVTPDPDLRASPAAAQSEPVRADFLTVSAWAAPRGLRCDTRADLPAVNAKRVALGLAPFVLPDAGGRV